MAWTEKMVEDLKIMWKQGLTTGEIGKRLGVSKNSIVGKVHRLQLDARPSPIKKKEDTLISKDQEVLEKLPIKKEKDIEDTKESICPSIDPEEKIDIKPVENFKKKGIIQLTDLDNHTCRWPLGDPKDENFSFCGKKVRVGQTYCEEHAAIAYVKPNKK